MNHLRRFRAPLGWMMTLLVAFWQVFSSIPARAATLYWDPDTNTVGNDVAGTGLGGSGTWDTSLGNWWNLASDGAWPNTSADQAIFTGPDGVLTLKTVTLGSTITANQLKFERYGYTLTGGTLNLAGTTPGVYVNMGEAVAINSLVTGTSGFTKTGKGFLKLGNSGNTYTGATTISNGTLAINNQAALGTDTSAVVVTGSITRGFGGGQLLLEGNGYAPGMTFTRNLSLQGYGPINDRSAALVSVGNNTLTGTVNMGVGTNSRVLSSNGTLTFSGTLDVAGTAGTTLSILGGVNAAGAGSFALTGALTGTGTLEKNGAGTLILSPSSTSGFSGTIRMSASASGTTSTVRITSAGVLGTRTSTGTGGVLDMNGGFLEIRMDAPNVLAGGTAATVYTRTGGTVFADHGVNSAGTVNGTVTFNQHAFEDGQTTTFASRNGYNMTFGGTAPVVTGDGNTTITNNMAGTLTFAGTFWSNTENGAARTMTINGAGNTVISGNFVGNAAAFDHVLTKSGTGLLTISSVGANLDGAVNIQAGGLAITDFRSISNTTGLGAVNIGATTVGGALIIGTSVAADPINLTSNRTINLFGSTGGATIYANQAGASGVVLGTVVNATAGAKTLTLGGTNTADNSINSALNDNGGALTLVKNGAGTWVLTGANGYTGTTTITNGTLKAKDTFSGTSRNVITNASAIIFNVLTVTQEAGGTFEYVGAASSASTELVGALTPTAGAATVRVTPGAGGTAVLTFASLAARGTDVSAGATINYDPSAGGSIAFTTGPTVTNGIIAAASGGAAYQTYRGVDWATLTGSTVSQYNGYTVNALPASGVAGANTNYSQSVDTATTGDTSVNTLKVIGGGSNPTINLVGTLTLTAKGLLFDNSAGTATISGGQLGAAAQETIIITNGTTAANALTVNSLIGSGAGSLTKSGSGVLVVGGANTYTGNTVISEGTIRMSGATSTLGSITTGNITTIRQGAALDVNSSVGTYNLVIGALSGAGTVTNSGNGASTAGTLSIGSATSTAIGTFTGVIQNGTGPTGGVLNVTKNGTGVQSLLGLNTYTGVTTIGSTGAILVDVLADIGQASGIGAGDVGNNAGSLVFTGSTGGLTYQGANTVGALTYGSNSVSTNRLFTLAGTGATLTSNAANGNAVVFSNTGDIVHGVIGPQSLVLRGSSTGDNRLNARITDSGTGANVTSVTKQDTGKWVLGSSNNTYSGATRIENGILELASGTSLSANSALILGNSGTSGILEMSGTFTRNLASTATAGAVTWNSNLTTNGGGGFAASGSKLVVAIGGVGTETALTWTSGGFVNNNAALVLSSYTALSEVEFRNAIDLNGASRTITVNDNVNTAADFATITGVISGTGTSNLVKNGAGILQLFGNNSYNGTTSISAGTLTVYSLGSTGAGTSSVGSTVGATANASAVIIGSGSTVGTLQYVGVGEISDRKIRLNSTASNGNQIYADGSGALILTNVDNTLVTGAKTLTLRGSNTSGNMITSQLSDNSGALSLNIDGNAVWILTNAANNYTGTTTVGAGALGIGANTALGTGTISVSNSTIFAYGGDRTIANAVSHVNNTTQAYTGDYTLNFTGTYALGASANNVAITNTIVDGRTLILNNITANSLGAARNFTINGTGNTIINGSITTNHATFALNLIYSGTGTLTLAGTGMDMNTGTLTLSSGTLRIGANEVIADSSATDSGNVVINPGAGVTATLDLNGSVETINGLTANSAGNIVIDNTSGNLALFAFGANNQNVDFGTGTGTYAITDSGAGALSIRKVGTGTATIGAASTLTYQGTTSVTGGTMTINAALNGSTGLSVTGVNSQLSLAGGIAAPGAITSVTVGNGSTLSLLDGAGNKLNSLTSLSLGEAGGVMSTLNLNVGDLSTTGDNLNTDRLSLGATGTLSLFSGNQITLNISDTGLRANTTYTLLSSVNGGFTSLVGGLTASDWLLGASPGGFSSLTLNVTDGLITLTTGTLLTNALYWNAGGPADNWNNVANWAQNKAGTTAATSIPGSGTDVVFIADNIVSGVAVSTTLEQNFKINSLTFEASTTPANTPVSITIAAGSGALPGTRLEIAPGVSTAGITMAAGASPSVTISAPLRIGANQTWHVADSASVLTLSGGLQGEADVIKTGAGRVVISAAAASTFNTGLTTDFTVNAGTLELTNATALGATATNNLANVTVNTGGAFYYNNATAGTVANALTLAGGTLSAGGNSQTYSGAVNVSANSFINMRDQNSATLTTTSRSITLSGLVSGTGNLTVDSINTVSSGNQITGNLTFNGNNTGWSGTLNILRGSVIANNANALGTGAINVELGKVSYTGIGGVTYNINKNVTIAAAAANAVLEWHVDRTTGTDPFTVDNSGTYTLGGAGGTGELRFYLADGTGSVPILSGGVILANNGRIVVRDAATSVATITGMGISQTGGARSLTINDVSVWGGTAGVLQIDVASTYTGGTTLSGGGLRFGHKDAIGTGTLTIAGSSTLSASTVLTGANKVMNAIALNNTLTFNGNNSLELGGPITMGASRTITANGTSGAQLLISGAITATGGDYSLTLSGTGSGIISGGFTQSGTAADLTISSGAWKLTGGTLLIADDILHNGGTVDVENVILSLNDDIVVTGATSVLNLNSAGVWAPTTPSGTSSFIYIRGGAVVNLNANDVSGVNNANGTDGFILADGTSAGIGTLNTNTFSITTNRIELGAIATGYEGRIIGSGTITVNNGTTDYTQGIRVYRGEIDANLAGSAVIYKQGLGDVTLSGDNSGLTGATAASTRIDAGNLILDYTTSNTMKIPSNRGLDMRGGTLTVNGNASAATTVTISGLTLANASGVNTIDVNSNGTAATLNLGAITRTALSNDGTIRFNLPALGAITTTTAITNGILGGWATVLDASGQVNFAAKQDVTNNIIAVTTTAQDNVSLWSITNHITDSAGISGTRQFTGISSLRFNASAAGSINVSPGGFFHVASGGVLMTDNVLTGAHTISGGTMSSQAGELTFILDSTAQGLTVSSNIVGGSGVTKAGNGTLTLSGYNVFSGATDLQSGTLVASGGFAIGDTSIVNLSDERASTFQITSNEVIGYLQGGNSGSGISFGVVNIGANTLTMRGGAAYGGIFTGSGQIIKDNTFNTGNLNLSGNSSGFTGTVVVNGGLFQISGSVGSLFGVTAFTVNKGGTFLIDNQDDSAPNDRISNSATFTLNSADGLYSGQTPVRGLAIRTDNNNGENETVGVITFNSGSNYFSAEATGGTSSVAFLLADNFVRNNSATLIARGTNLGGTTNARSGLYIGTTANETAFISSNLVGGGGAAGTEQMSIVPWAIGQSAATTTDTTMGNSLVTYVAGFGFRPLDFTTEYNSFAVGDYEGATDNVRESRTTDLTGLATTTVNSLVVNNDNTSASSTINVMGNGAGQSLTITSGVMLFTLNSAATGTHGIQLGGFGNGIAAGSTGEYLIYVVNPSGLTTGPVLTTTISSNLTSTADITKSGRGTLILSGTNTAGGGARKTTLNEGVLQIGDLDNIGGNTGTIVFAGGTLRLGTGFLDDVSVRTMTMLLGGGTLDTNGGNYILANAIGGGGAGGFTKAGLGSLTLQQAVTYTGLTNVANGRLILEGGNNRLATGAALVMGSGTTSGVLQLGSAGGASDQTVSDLLVSGTGTTNAIVGGNAAVSTLTVNTATTSTYSGAFGGAGANENNIALVKTGSGALTLTGASTFTGGISVKAGTLIIGNSATAMGAATNAITLGDTSGSAAAVLNIQNTQTYSQTITVAAGSTGPLSILGGNTTGAPILNGGIVLNNNVIIGKLGTTGNFTLNGGITGTGNVTIANMGTTGQILINTGAVNHAGSITNSGFATVATVIGADVGSNVTHITQDSVSSALTLSGTNIGYTGTTTVNAGVLNITGAAATGLSTTGIVVAAGGTLNVVNTAGQALNLGAGTLNLGAGTGTATLGFELGSLSAYDSFNTTAAAITANSIVFNLTGLSGFGLGSYDLLTAASGLNNASYSLGSISGAAAAGRTFSITVAPTFVRLNSVASTGDFYWRGGVNNSWVGFSSGNSNFTTDAAGTINASGTPGAASTVYFSALNATGPTISTTLDASFTINALRFLSAPSGVTTVTIAPGTPTSNSLTIAPSSSTDGINVADNAGNITISAPLVLGANQTWTVAGTGANGSSLTVSGVITGSGTLTIASPGAGLVTLSGLNTYSGATTVSGGILRASVANGFSVNSAYTISSGGILRLNNFNNAIGSLAGAGIVENGGASGVTLTAGANNTDTTFSGTLQNGGVGSLALTKTGNGTLTLSGAVNNTGGINVNGGTLVATGTSTATGNIVVGGATTKSVLNVLAGGTLTGGTLNVGTVTGSFGAVNIKGGTLTMATPETTDNIAFGSANGGYGAFTISSGTFTQQRFMFGGNSGTSAAGGIGVGLVTGGQVNTSGYIILARAGASTGVLTITGGVINHSSASQNINVGWQGSGRAELNVAGGLIDNTGRNVAFGGGTWTGTGILNLNAGVLLTNSIAQTSGTSYLNFNGGTLRAATASTTFVASGITATYVNGAFGTFAGGAVIDTNGFNNTIVAPMLTPTGNGVHTLSLTNGGSGYIGAPYVQITGDGTGATGYAVVDTDPASATFGQVTSIVITNPGVNYTNVSITLVGGGGTGATASGTLAANTSGGLTKTGFGTLTLSGANTYTGGTTVLAGTLALGANDVLADVGAVTVNGGNFDINTRTETVGTVLLQSGAITGTTGVLTGTAFNLESGSVSAILAGTADLNKNTAGTVTLSGNNTFSGAVNLNAGVLVFSAATHLGNGFGTNAINFNGGTLNYTATGPLTLSPSQPVNILAGGGTFDVSSSTGSLTVMAGVTGTAGGDLTKIGAGTLILSGTNNLGAGGAVNVTAGTLRAGFGTNGASAITVSSTGTLELVNNAAETLTLSGTPGALTLSGGATLGFELGSPGLSDAIVLAAGGTALVNGTITLNFYNLGALGSGTYNLITILGGGGGLNAANFVIGNAPSGFNYTINKTDTTLQLVANALAFKYWTGFNLDGSWASNLGGDTNWSTDAAGLTISPTTPGADDAVIFSASNAGFSSGSVIDTTLDGNRTIDSLQFISTPTGVAGVNILPGTGGILTIAPDTATNGIFVAANGGNIVISAALTADKTQTWNVNGTGASLAVTGNTIFTGRVTKTGAGALTLSGTNSGAGGITLDGGTLNINSTTALGTGSFSIGAGTTINNSTGAGITLTTNNTMVWDGSFTFTGTQSLNLGTGGVTLGAPTTITASGNTLTVGGVITDGASSFGLGKDGAGTLTLTNANTFDGGMTLSAGTLNINNASAIGTGTFTINGGTINNTSAAAITLANNNASIWNGNFTFTGTQSLNLGTGAVNFGTAAGTSRTVTVSGGNLTVGGPITDGTTANSLIKLGAGTLTLGGLSTTAANNYTGGTTLGGGTMVLTSSAVFTGGLTIGDTAARGNISTLNLNTASATFNGASSVVTNSTTANTVTIGAGQALQLNGSLLIGYDSGATTNTRLTVSGAGAFRIGAVGAPSNQNVTLGGNTAASGFSNAAVLDMSGLSTFYANLGIGTFRVGSTTNGTGAATAGSTLILAANSTIIAATITQDSNDSAVTQSIKLGSGTNILNAGTITIGASGARSNGELIFNGPTGTLEVRNQAGNGRANMNLANGSAGTAASFTGTVDLLGHYSDLLLGTLAVGGRSAGTTGSGTGIFKFDTGILDATTINVAARTGTTMTTGSVNGEVTLGGGTSTVGTMTLGTNNVNFNTTTGTGDATATLLVSGGTHTITTMTMGVLSVTNTSTIASGSSDLTASASFSGGTTTIGTLTMGTNTSAATTINANLATSTLNISGTAVVNVTNNLTMGTTTLRALNSATAAINITGGSLTVGGNIVYTDGLGVESNTVTLDGGSLDMTNGNIGASTALVTFNAQSGTLSNVAQINGGTGLTKTTAGMLTLEGLNAYTGGTTISAGVLQVGSGSTTGTLGSGNVTNNSTLRFNRSNSYTATQVITGSGAVQQVGSGITVLNAANTYAGGTTISAGTVVANHTSALGSGDILVNSTGTLSIGDAARLNVNGGGSLNSSGTLVFDIFSRQAGTNAVTNNDLLTLNSADNTDTITLSGTLRVVDTTGTSAASWGLNDMWQLIDWSTFAGAKPAASTNFAGFSALDLPTLGSNLSWYVITDANGLYLSVGVVPEPSRILLLAFGFMLLIFRRRRK